jgi:protease I
MADKPQDIYVSTLPSAGKGKSILILTANETQDLEFFYPYYRFLEAGFRVDVATPHGGEFKGKMGMGLKQTKRLHDVTAAAYDLLYIPGGKAPAELMQNEEALRLTKRFAESGKPIAAICHGAQVLAAAHVIEGKRIAAWPEVQKEIEAAGGIFINEPVVMDRQFITARWPGDLPAHLKAIIDMLHSRATRSAPLPHVA